MARDTASARWARDELDFCADWEVVPLSEVADQERGITYGIVQPGPMTPGGVPIVRVNNVKGGRIETVDVHYVSHAIAAKYERTRLRGGEVLLTLVGTVGETAIVPPEMAGWNTARAVAVIPVKPEIGPEWVDLCLRSAPLQHLIDVWCTTTVQKTFNLKEVWELPIPLPPPKERDAIARVLGGLDDKIELNRRMNRTLEDLARGLFRSWFVDFDPVTKNGSAKAPTAPHGLFPKRLIDSDLGPIPEGWKVAKVYEHADVIYGAPFASGKFNTVGRGLPLIRIRDLDTHNPEVWTDEEHPKGTRTKAGDIVVGMDGEFRAHVWRGPECWLNQRMCQFKPKRADDAAFVLYAIEPLLAEVERSEVGTTVIHLGKADIDRFKVVVPPRGVMDAFAKVAQPMLDRMVANGIQSRSLAATRDMLLPQLLSGEIRLKAAERSTQEVLA